jgi:hypothetical protein
MRCTSHPGRDGEHAEVFKREHPAQLSRDSEDSGRPTSALLPLALTLFGTAVAWKHIICHADLVFHAKISTLI